MFKWMTSVQSAASDLEAVFNYVTGDDDPVGTIVVESDRVSFQTPAGCAKADNVGHAKRAVEMFVRGE